MHQQASFGLNSAGISPAMNAAATTKPMASDSTYSAEDSLKTASFGLNSGGLGPTMNAPALARWWMQQPASFGLDSRGLSPAMNAAAAIAMKFNLAQPGSQKLCQIATKITAEITTKINLKKDKQRAKIILKKTGQY
jgi:hypothetical protein